MPDRSIAKAEIEIVYCAPCDYFGLATWMATEFWKSQEPGNIAIKLTPVGKGRLEVYFDGEKIYDRKAEGNKYPDLTRVSQIKLDIADRLYAMDGATDKSV